MLRRALFLFAFTGLVLLTSLSGKGDVPLLPSTVLGTLDPELLGESSGIAVSQRFPDRLYHVNDSGGNGFAFYYTDMRGTSLRETQMNSVKRGKKDMEELTLGPCGASRCLYLGNIGDNWREREDIDVVYVEEEALFEDRTDFWQHLKLRFPDGKHDVEAMAVHPNGDLYLLTKSWRVYLLVPAPARLYKISHERIEAAPDAEPQTLTFVGELDLSKLSGTTFGSVATSMDIAPSGDKFLVLTYRDVLEFHTDLSKDTLDLGAMVRGQDYDVLNVAQLPQQEAIAYLPNGRDFIYTSELRGGYEVAEIVKVERE